MTEFINNIVQNIVDETEHNNRNKTEKYTNINLL